MALHDAGVHTTLAGVILGLMAPTRPFRQSELVDEDALLDISTVETAAETAMLARESVSVVEWMEHLLHPWTSFLIVPLFALANAGIPITSTSVSNALRRGSPTASSLASSSASSSVWWARTWIATRLRIGTLPADATWRGIVGVGALAGIGFTVSLFVAGLAFDDEPILQNKAKIGILAASLIAAAFGSVILLRRRESRPS